MKKFDIIFRKSGSGVMSYIEAESKDEAIKIFKEIYEDDIKGHKMVKCEEVIEN